MLLLFHLAGYDQSIVSDDNNTDSPCRCCLRSFVRSFVRSFARLLMCDCVFCVLRALVWFVLVFLLLCVMLFCP